MEAAAWSTTIVAGNVAGRLKSERIPFALIALGASPYQIGELGGPVPLTVFDESFNVTATGGYPQSR